jgi:Mg2+ and Co2+ transporter CorA
MDWIVFAVIAGLVILAWYWWPKSDLNNDGKVDAKDAVVKVNDQITDAVTQVVNKTEEEVVKVARKVADKAEKNVTKRKAKSAGKTKKA